MSSKFQNELYIPLLKPKWSEDTHKALDMFALMEFHEKWGKQKIMIEIVPSSEIVDCSFASQKQNPR